MATSGIGKRRRWQPARPSPTPPSSSPATETPPAGSLSRSPPASPVPLRREGLDRTSAQPSQPSIHRQETLPPPDRSATNQWRLTMMRYALGSALALAVAAVAQPALAQQASSGPAIEAGHTLLTVSAEGSTSRKPDLA